MMSSINGGSGSALGSPNFAVQDKFPEYSAADAKLKAREWQFQLKLEMKGLDREIKKVQLEEGKLKKAMTLQAQKGNMGSVEPLARSIVRSRQAVARLRKARAAMTDIDLHLTSAIASMSMKHAMRVSADAMRDMSKVAPVSEMGPAMQEMQRELAYSAEVEDAVEEALHDDDDEAEATTEVQKVLEELELERLGLLTTTRASPIGEAALANTAMGAGSSLPLLAGQRGTAVARQGGS
jgi:charged multivesicular body protein 3